MKISFCGCAINAKHEVRKFIEFIDLYNQEDLDYEVCVALDDRVKDGSYEEFKKLEQEFPDKFKFCHVTHEDTVAYLEKLLRYYETRGLFSSIMSQLKGRFEKFAEGTLFDPHRTFLWMSSGRLYNKAVSISSGDVLVIGPGDFLPLYSVHDITSVAQSMPGSFYSKPHAAFVRLSNQDKHWLEDHLARVNSGEYHRPNYRWDTDQVFIDYLRYPTDIKDYYIPDFRHNRLLNLADPDLRPKLHQLSQFAQQQDGMQALRNFHGTHIMTRDVFNDIGGFTEEFYGRAFADDKMTANGRRYFRQSPDHISFAWIYPGEVLPDRGQGYDFDYKERLKEIDPLWDKHPVPPVGPVYLHDGVDTGGIHFPDLVNRTLSKNTPPVRID